MTFPLDKLGVINSGLTLCGDDICNAPEDGSDYWTVGSAAYENAIEYLLESHDWKGLTTVAVLQPLTAAPSDDMFTTGYGRPPDCVHIIWVRLSDAPITWQILGNQIVLNASGTAPGQVLPPGTTPGPVTMKYVSSTNAGPESGNLSRLFTQALIAFVRAGLYGGLHEDAAREDAWAQRGERLLEKAKTRSDQEQPKRAMFNSRIAAARRIRKPYLNVPTGWGGTGFFEP